MELTTRLVLICRPLQVLLAIAMLTVASLEQYNHSTRYRLYLLLFGIAPTTLLVIGDGVYTIFAKRDNDGRSGLAMTLRWAADLFIFLALSAIIPVFVIASIDDGYFEQYCLDMVIEILVVGANTLLFLATFIILLVEDCRSGKKKSAEISRPLIIHLDHEKALYAGHKSSNASKYSPSKYSPSKHSPSKYSPSVYSHSNYSRSNSRWSKDSV